MSLLSSREKCITRNVKCRQAALRYRRVNIFTFVYLKIKPNLRRSRHVILQSGLLGSNLRFFPQEQGQNTDMKLASEDVVHNLRICDKKRRFSSPRKKEVHVSFPQKGTGPTN